MKIWLAALLLVVGFAQTAAADVTGFVGIVGTQYLRQNLYGPTSQLGWGVSFDTGGKVAFEAEFADTGRAPNGLGYRTFMANLTLNAWSKGRVGVYATGGGGFFHERFQNLTDTGFGGNAGVGVKFNVQGPFGVRGDYRVFLFQNAFANPVHRAYMGATFDF